MKYNGPKANHSNFLLWLLQLESLKLLSTAERLGLLSTLERLLVSDPAAISSLSLPLLVASLGEHAFTSSSTYLEKRSPASHSRC